MRGEPDAAVVEVADNGRTICDEAATRAFEPFFHLRDGHGVGLAVTRSITEAMGGTVALAARPGGGLVVTLRLPTRR